MKKFIKSSIILFFVSIFLISNSCKQNETSEIEKIIVDENFIKALISQRDSIKVKHLDNGIGTTYFVNDGSEIYVWRDSLQRIRAWFKDIKEVRIEGAEVYETTGQIKGKLNYVNGYLDGAVKYYYDNGRVKSQGFFKNKQWWGEWKNYDKEGKLVSITNYDGDSKTTIKIGE